MWIEKMMQKNQSLKKIKKKKLLQLKLLVELYIPSNIYIHVRSTFEDKRKLN